MAEVVVVVSMEIVSKSLSVVYAWLQRTGAQRIGVHTGPLQQGQIYSGGTSVSLLSVGSLERKLLL